MRIIFLQAVLWGIQLVGSARAQPGNDFSAPADAAKREEKVVSALLVNKTNDAGNQQHCVKNVVIRDWWFEVDFVLKHHGHQPHSEKENLPSPFAETQELKIFAMGMIRFYQLFISPQHNDQSICIFTPSCSRFALQAIKKYGFWQGMLMASERLQRCHGFAGKYYHRHGLSAKYYDPIEKYDWRNYRKNRLE